MKKISMTSILFFAIGLVLIVLCNLLGSALYDNATHATAHRCTYGYSTKSVEILGFELYHVESCTNLFLALGVVAIIIGLCIFAITFNKPHSTTMQPGGSIPMPSGSTPIPTPMPGGAWICSRCGVQNPVGKFCQRCGNMRQ